MEMWKREMVRMIELDDMSAIFWRLMLGFVPIEVPFQNRCG